MPCGHLGPPGSGAFSYDAVDHDRLAIAQLLLDELTDERVANVAVGIAFHRLEHPLHFWEAGESGDEPVPRHRRRAEVARDLVGKC